MQAVIMAGGKGTRLSSVTQNIPKPMIPIKGKPLLEYQIENLKSYGVTDIILVIGYLGSFIKNYFGDGTGFGCSISYFEESVPLGTAGALGKIYNCLDETFLLLFGDIFLSVDFSKFIIFHESNSADISLFAHPNSHPFDSDLIEIDASGRIIGWSSKNNPRDEAYLNLVNAGLYVVSKKVAKKIKDRKEPGKIDFEKDLIIPNLRNIRIFAYRSTEYVKDIGTPERLASVIEDIENGVPDARNLKNLQKCIFLDRDGTINKYVGFLNDASQVTLEENVGEAIKKINRSEYLVIVITNQPVLARGECTESELNHIHNRIYALLGNCGAYVDGLYYCPHHPDSGFDGEIKKLKINCDCRKPKIGLLKEAEKDFNICLSKSWFIGDSYIDVETGINAGMKTILLESGDSNKRKKEGINPDYIVRNLLDAVNVILR